MAKTPKHTICAARPQPPREDPELFGSVFAFDCSSVSTAAAAVREFQTARAAHGSLLLYNTYSMPASELAVCAAAGKKLFEYVKVEIDITGAPEPREVSLIAAIADAVVLCATAKSSAALFSIFECARNASRIPANTILKISLSTSAKPVEIEGLAAAASRAGAKHMVLTCGKLSKNAEAACANAAEKYDLTVELASPAATRAWRGRAARENEAKELLLDIPFCKAGGETIPLGAVFQLSFKCNQNCIFCTGENTLPAAPRDFILATLRRVLDDGTQRVVFTGGEPTLDPALPKYIAMCRAARVPEISVFTNGMAFASMAYTRKLREAGMDTVLVSLHSARPDVSDAITRSPGGFEKTVKGISNLTACGVPVVINYVVCARSYRETPSFIGFVRERFAGTAVNLSFIAPVLDSSARKSVVPKISAAAPYIMRALDEAYRLGVTAAGLEPHLGIPPCALGADPRYFPFLFPFSEPLSGFVKSDACADCRCGSACPGVRKNYAALHGLDELKPVAENPTGKKPV